ncbi:sugar diacid recognition domain-containing protein [Nocardioides zeae]|uniref:Sugar diacid recognition domain-containing protein n=1 Tax=Nocardioides imazamoxiresistens TaxID=3231893 RepID=A0ABU3PXW3_9ACTN|nr:sugar diacid recognition domain-containing protein [Nocardioides zeae]MDT9594085.1 sugar diacid recognition domain-containing protein [Nocardioides zeae]
MAEPGSTDASSAGAPLSAELGQRVVDVVASTIRQDINLMDAGGMVVASTVPERVGKPHRAARRVLAGGRPVVVTRVVEGVVDRPGINVPLELDGQVAGVVGITGDPRTVEPIAHVVALTMQLLLTQEREHDSANLTRTRTRELVSTLASARSSTPALLDRLRSAGLGSGPWSIAVWADPAPRPDGSAAPPPHAEHTVTVLNDRRLRTDGPCAVVMHGLLWVVAAGGRGIDPGLGGAATRRLVVDGLDDVDDLASWAHDLKALGRLARLLPEAGAGAGVEQLRDAEAAIGVAHLPDRTLRRLARTAARLAPAQRETVRVVARAPSLAAAAAELFVHRNTLLQRVERIRTLTGLDLRRPDHAAVLRSATLAHEATAGDPGA